MPDELKNAGGDVPQKKKPKISFGRKTLASEADIELDEAGIGEAENGLPGDLISDDQKKKSKRKGTMSRYYHLPAPMKVLFICGTMACIALFTLHYKGVPLWIPWSDKPYVLSGVPYYYLLYVVLVFNIFMGLGATRKQRSQAPKWFDYGLAIVLLACFVYFFANAQEIQFHQFEPPPDILSFTAALVVGILALEAARRIGGIGYITLLIVSIVYPLFAGSCPGVFQGMSQSFWDVIGDFAYGANGLRGLPGIMLGSTILGFYLFAGMMMGMGGGEFFLRLATSLLGWVRGGPAKVAVLASGFFGSLSGSIVANIAGTGAFTIPAMKRMGYPPHYAGAIEGCASTGGDTMPPIMGGTVFICAVLSGLEYATIMVAAFLPTLLYYYGLLIQVDAYAAKTNLKGLPRNMIPKVLPTLASGWMYLICLAFLIAGLLYFRWGYVTPVWATFLMIGLVALDGAIKLAINRHRTGEVPHWRIILSSSGRRLEEAMVHTAGLINFGAAVFVSMGFILVGLFETGVAASLTSWIVSLGAGNVFVILVIAMVFNLIMGMVGLQRASYLFLAVTMVPAIVSLNPEIPKVLLHLFVIFYVGYGGLTPPVALHAFIAASIAQAEPMKTAWLSLRLGIVLFFIPFFFVFQPALALIGTWYDIAIQIVLAVLGIYVLTSGLEGYIGKLGVLNWLERGLFIVGGFMVVFPNKPFVFMGIQMPAYTPTMLGAAITILTIMLVISRKKVMREKRPLLTAYVEYPG